MKNIFTKNNVISFLNKALSRRVFCKLTDKKKNIFIDLASLLLFNKKSIYLCDQIRKYIDESVGQPHNISSKLELFEYLKSLFNIPSKSNYKDFIFLDSYWLFSVGHLAVLLSAANALKRKKVIIALNVNFSLCTDNSSIIYLRKILGDKLILSFSSSLFYNVLCDNKVFIKNTRQIKRDEIFNPTNQIPPKFYNKKIPSILTNKNQSNNMLMSFHLRTSEFRGWKSYRDGLNLDEYTPYFEFLQRLKILPIVFALNDKTMKPIHIDAFRDRKLNSHNQIEVFQRSDFVVGSSSGLTHFGPFFNRPSIYFDMIRPIAVISKKNSFILFKNYFNKKSNYKEYFAPIEAPLFIDHDEQDRYEKNQELLVKNNSSEDLINSTIDLIFFSKCRDMLQKKITQNDRNYIKKEFGNTFQKLSNLYIHSYKIKKQIMRRLKRRKEEINKLAFFEDIVNYDQILQSNFL